MPVFSAVMPRQGGGMGERGRRRASEFMDFDAAGRVVRSEAFYGK
ncbi:hypothetical protein [Bradyrhizobium ivorense]|nr:hypothetical protein [Bradyrhizobium ivorense]VIO68980.1 hypothetical protein CI41S_16350 [Bradyrhizobium ivorense]